MNADEILETIEIVHDIEYYKSQFLKDLKIEDIDDEPLEKKYTKWLIKKFKEEL